MEKHYVEFLSPGTFVSESDVREIDSWDSEKAVEMAREITQRYNAKPFGFRFFTKARGDEDFEPKVTATSKMYYINGTVMTVDEVRGRRNPDERILLSNMEGNGWGNVVTTYTPWKYTSVFNDGDQIVIMK
jgi:hypothetical protein